MKCEWIVRVIRSLAWRVDRLLSEPHIVPSVDLLQQPAYLVRLNLDPKSARPPCHHAFIRQRSWYGFKAEFGDQPLL